MASALTVFVIGSSLLLYFLTFSALLWRYVGYVYYGTIVTDKTGDAKVVDASLMNGSGQAVLVLWGIEGILLSAAVYVLQRRSSLPFVLSLLILGIGMSCFSVQLVLGGCDFALAALNVGDKQSCSFDLMISCCQILFITIVFLNHYYRKPGSTVRSSDEIGMHLIGDSSNDSDIAGDQLEEDI